MPAASTIKPKEREFVVDSGASLQMVSKRDLNSAEVETMRISKNPTTVMTANGEVQTREEATEYVKELDLFLTVTLLEETPAVLSLGKLCEDHGYTHHWTSGQKPHLTQKMAKTSIAIKRTTYHSLSLVCRRVSSTSSSPASSTSSSQDTVISTENPATERRKTMSEESRGNPSRGSAETEKHKIKMKTTKNYEVNNSNICRNGYRISRRIWSIIMFNTLPALPMNYQWSREQKWYWVGVSIVSILTPRKTAIVSSA